LDDGILPSLTLMLIFGLTVVSPVGMQRFGMKKTAGVLKI
jgi:hypothetical protein